MSLADAVVVLPQSRGASEIAVASFTVEGMCRRVLFMLLQSLVALESPIAEYATDAHNVKSIADSSISGTCLCS